MKVKVGQWARTPQGNIFNIKDNVFSFDIMNNKGKYDHLQVADTPQELIQVRDLVRVILLTGCKLFEIENKKDIYDLRGANITEILTPNGKDYICQWGAQ